MNIPFIAIGASILSLLWAVALIVSVLNKKTGDQTMQDIANAIQEGAMAYLNRQFKTIAVFAIIIFLILGFALPANGF